MSVARSFLALATTFGLVVALAPPARAGLFTRNAECARGTTFRRCEWGAELRNAKRFEPMTCAEIAGYAESYRMQLNQQILSRSFRPVAEQAPAAAPISQPNTLSLSDLARSAKP